MWAAAVVLLWLQSGWRSISAVWLAYWLCICTYQTSSTLLWWTTFISTISPPVHQQGDAHCSVEKGTVKQKQHKQ